MVTKPETYRDGQNVLLIHDQLRAAILRGNLPPGQATSQLELARDFSIGRTPLREALRLLQREGLVQQEPNRRVRISDLSVADAEEIYAMRVVLEAAAMRLTVPALTAVDFAELEGLLAQMDHYMRIQDLDRMDAPHRAFHLRFVGLAGTRWVEEVAQLFDHAERYRRSYFKARPGYGQLRRAEHRDMFEAASAGKVDLTVRHMARHYAHTALVVLDQLDPGYKPARLQTTLEAIAPGVLTELKV